MFGDTDLFVLGARDLRAGRQLDHTELDPYQRQTYEAGRAAAFKKACHRLDVADVLPAYFSS
jgi:hypothetical protein